MQRPLSIAVVARAVMPLHGVGGLERAVHDHVRHLAARGVNVTLIVPPARPVRRESSSDPFASPHIQVRHVPYISFPFANRRGTVVVDRSTAYLAYGWRAGRLALSLAAAGDVDLIHGHGASVLGAATRGRRVPLVFNPHGLEEFGATGNDLPMLKRLGYGPLRYAVRRIAASADAIIATDVSLEPAVVRHLRPRAGQMHTVPNGVDLVAASALAGHADGLLIRQRHAIGSGETVFLSVGRLDFNKGLDRVPEALARAVRPDGSLAATGWRWVVVGAGPLRATIEAEVHRHGLDAHVIFAGRLTDRDVHAWYEGASALLHPTRYEGSSIVTLEAMAHRRPIIATIAGGLPDKVKPGINGWLVEPNDPAALAAALAEAGAQASRLPAMGMESRAIVDRDFAWPVLIEKQIAIYEELLRR